MILLSEDGKGLVKIESWDDVLDRPGYTPSIDPKDVSIKQIIGRYHIFHKQPCGISSCGTEHNKGYLVVCDGGIETNIGNKCGKRIFGVDFQNMEKTFVQDTNAQRYRENISRFMNQIGEIENKASALINGDFGALKRYDEMHWLATKGFEDRNLRGLGEMSRSGNGMIYEQIELSKREKEIAKETGSNAVYREELIGIIAGIKAFSTHKTLRKLINVDFGEELISFKALDPDELEFKDLRRWNRWASTLERKLSELEEISLECQRFMSKDNLDFIRVNKHRL